MSSHNHSDHKHTHDHNHSHDDAHEHTHEHHHEEHERKTKWVVVLTIFTMVLEIVIGYFTNSMALTAEGWHMSTHVLAIGLTFLAYYFSRKYAKHHSISFNRSKLLALSGFTSAIILQTIAVLMAIESIERLIHPLPIHFNEAIYVAIIGLIVNAISAKLLHHDHQHSDHSMRAAYIHVIADLLTSVVAIIALTVGMYLNNYWLDALSGVIGSIVITSWSVQLIVNSGKELIEFVKSK